MIQVSFAKLLHVYCKHGAGLRVINKLYVIYIFIRLISEWCIFIDVPSGNRLGPICSGNARVWGLGARGLGWDLRSDCMWCCVVAKFLKCERMTNTRPSWSYKMCSYLRGSHDPPMSGFGAAVPPPPSTLVSSIVVKNIFYVFYFFIKHVFWCFFLILCML